MSELCPKKYKYKADRKITKAIQDFKIEFNIS